MGELMIRNHDFEIAKQGLKEFAQKDPKNLNISSVETEAWGGLFDHKVTGEEFNNRIAVIQGHLIDLNNLNNRTIKEFGQVYNALEALDRDYIQAILLSIKASEKNSAQIKRTQNDIKKLVDEHGRILTILKNFKQEIDSYEHLEDIDQLWEETRDIVQKQEETIEAIITEIAKRNDIGFQDLNRKIKYMYLIAGGFLGIALIELVIIILKGI